MSPSTTCEIFEQKNRHEEIRQQANKRVVSQLKVQTIAFIVSHCPNVSGSFFVLSIFFMDLLIFFFFKIRVFFRSWQRLNMGDITVHSVYLKLQETCVCRYDHKYRRARCSSPPNIHLNAEITTQPNRIFTKRRTTEQSINRYYEFTKIFSELATQIFDNCL